MIEKSTLWLPLLFLAGVSCSSYVRPSPGRGEIETQITEAVALFRPTDHSTADGNVRFISEGEGAWLVRTRLEGLRKDRRYWLQLVRNGECESAPLLRPLPEHCLVRRSPWVTASPDGVLESDWHTQVPEPAGSGETIAGMRVFLMEETPGGKTHVVTAVAGIREITFPEGEKRAERPSLAPDPESNLPPLVDSEGRRIRL